MKIGGYQPCSLCDFPGQVSAVVFTQGCNFRCPFCHNAGLLPFAAPAERLISANELLERLTRRRGQLDAVVITGGEPTLQHDLADFLQRLRQMGFRVKLDTNGSRPEVLRDLIAAGLLDYVAMDLKSPWHKYEELAGMPVEVGRLRASLRLIAESGIPHEFRTTLVPALLSENDLAATRAQAPDGSPYRLQPFHPEHALDSHLSPFEAPDRSGRGTR
jgi:pyruvate formate lyase activating enzyme